MAEDSMTKSKRDRVKPNCPVCGDINIRASPNNNSASCRPCKEFFRRTKCLGLIYHCRKSNACGINKEDRNCCRACRFKKCVAAGLEFKFANKTVSEMPSMKQSAKQNPENGNGLGELFVTPAITINAPITAKLLTSHSAILPNKMEKKEGIESNKKHAPATCVQHQGNLLENHKKLNGQIDTVIPLGSKRTIPFYENPATSESIVHYFVDVERYCHSFFDTSFPYETFAANQSSSSLLPLPNLKLHLGAALKEPGSLFPRTQLGLSAMYTHFPGMLSRAYIRKVVHYFDWVSHVPEFVDLSDHDKEVLLATKGTQLTCLQSAYYSAVQRLDGMVAGCGAFLPADPVQQRTLDPTLKEALNAYNMTINLLVRPFQEIKLTEQEYVLLFVISLFHNASKLSERGQQRVASACGKYANALRDWIQRVVAQSGGSREEGNLRFQEIIRFLTAIQQVGEEGNNVILYWTIMNRDNLRSKFMFDYHVKAY